MSNLSKTNNEDNNNKILGSETSRENLESVTSFKAT